MLTDVFYRLFMNFGLTAAVHFRELRPLELTTSCTSALFLWIWLTSVMPGLRPKLVYIYANYLFDFYKRDETLVVCCLLFPTETMHTQYSFRYLLHTHRVV